MGVNQFSRSSGLSWEKGRLGFYLTMHVLFIILPTNNINVCVNNHEVIIHGRSTGLSLVVVRGRRAIL